MNLKEADRLRRGEDVAEMLRFEADARPISANSQGWTSSRSSPACDVVKVARAARATTQLRT
jgi:hypothetical protein